MEAMENLWICLNVYAEEQLLPECLDSIKKAHPEAKIVAVDGAYDSWIREVKKLIAHQIEYNHDQVAEQLERFIVPISTDRTLEILKDYKVDVVIGPEINPVTGEPTPWAHEYIKRSKYFVGTNGDWYFVIDADERLVGKLDVGALSDDAYNIDLLRDDQMTPYPILRIFKHQDGMEYRGAHHALWVGDKLYRKEYCVKVTGCSLYHRAVHRNEVDPIRHLAKGAYYRILTSNEEGAFRHQYGL